MISCSFLQEINCSHCLDPTNGTVHADKLMGSQLRSCRFLQLFFSVATAMQAEKGIPGLRVDY